MEQATGRMYSIVHSRTFKWNENKNRHLFTKLKHFSAVALFKFLRDKRPENGVRFESKACKKARKSENANLQRHFLKTFIMKNFPECKHFMLKVGLIGEEKLFRVVKSYKFLWIEHDRFKKYHKSNKYQIIYYYNLLFKPSLKRPKFITC